MAEENTVLDKKLTHKGFLSFKGLYEFSFEWLQDQGYAVSEKEYKEKISGSGKNIEIKWEAIKEVTDYFRYKIEIGWKVLGLSEVEVEEEGKKIKTGKGEISMKFRGVIVRDPEARWEKKPLWKFLRGTYDKYIIRTTAEEHAGKVSSDANELIDQIKAFLNLGK